MEHTRIFKAGHRIHSLIKKLVKKLYGVAYAVLIFQLAGCGTMMYPERRGQTDGRIDAGVAVMDGLCLLLFIIPGVVAYAVDFSSGAIYLPGTVGSYMNIKDIQQVKFDPRHYTNATIERIIGEETGCMVKLNQKNIKILRLVSLNDMMARFAEVVPEIKNNRIALSMR